MYLFLFLLVLKDRLKMLLPNKAVLGYKKFLSNQ